MTKRSFVFLLALTMGSFFAVSSGGGQEKVEKTEQGEETSSPPPGTVEITPDRQQIIGVRVGTVEKKSVSHTLRVLGRISADETKIYRINASVDGWIQETRPNTVGSLVKKDEVLASFYSPEFLGVQQAFIYALGTMDRSQLVNLMQSGRKETGVPLASNLLNLQRQIDALRNLGMGDKQIEEIGRTGQITQEVRIISPAHGFVTARNVSPGQRFSKGDALFQIVDLGRVWILADVYEHEAQYFQAGARAAVTLPYQHRKHSATVSKVLPLFDASTRTLKVRLEMENPGFELRPDMFVDVELPVTFAPAIAVPVDAVLHSGLRKTVFVARGKGSFERRAVQTGRRMGEHIEITDGLNPGEQIVLSGNFFVDSESRLQLAGQGIFGTMSVDPVCGMEVDETKARATGRSSTYRGKTYSFCSDGCKEHFDKDPERFVNKPAEGKEKSTSHTRSGGGHD
jgi:multidrug efflux pump subunit AcrA (membrane-fusion protein)/YHS domain-containing protein